MKILANRFTPAINLIIAFCAWYANKTFQVFCQPVLWASIVLVLFVLLLSFHEFIKKNKIVSLISMFFQGTGVLICIYCSIFFMTDEGGPNILFTMIFGIGLLMLSPLYFVLQCVRNFTNEKNRLVRIAFLGGIVIPIIIQIFFVIQYLEFYKISSKDQRLEVLSNELPHNYMSERIIGMHFKYHTRIDLYDGWRPPLHDPILNVCSWVTGINDPLSPMDLETRIALYKMTFPELNVMENCSCADNPDGNSYLTDPRLK